MWMITLGHREMGPDKLPGDETVKFSFARDALDWLETLDSEQGSLKRNNIAAVGVQYRSSSPSRWVSARLNLNEAEPIPSIETLIHALGEMLEPHALWEAPPLSSEDYQIRRPETRTGLENRQGSWSLEWLPRENSSEKTWAKAGWINGDGIKPDEDWMIRRMAPLFSAKWADENPDKGNP